MVPEMRPNPTWILLILGVVLALTACSSEEERLEAASAEVAEAATTGDRARALEALAPLRGTDPSTPEALLELADLLARAGETPESFRLLEKGAERYPERSDIQVALAGTALKLSNPAAARAAARTVPADAAEHPRALELEAQAELALGDLDRALELLDQAEAAYPDRFETRALRIATLTRENRHEEALAQIETALSELPTGALNLVQRQQLEFARVQALLATGEKEEAETWLRTRVSEEEGDLAAWRTLGDVLIQSNRVPEAIELVSAAAAPANPGLYDVLAKLLLLDGQTDAAEQALTDLATYSPTPTAVGELIKFLVEQGEFEKAGDALRKATASSPTEPALKELEVELELAERDASGAREALERYRAFEGASDPKAEFLLARVELEEGDAASAARRLRDVAPSLDIAALHYWLGKALEAQGDLDGAVRGYGIATSRDPKWVAPYLAAADLAARRGDAEMLTGLGGILVARAPGLSAGPIAMAEGRLLSEQFAEAERIAGAGRKRFPEDPTLLGIHSRALARVGKAEEALAVAREALEKYPEDPALAAGHAETVAYAESPAAALKAAQAAEERFPESAAVVSAVAGIAYLAGEASVGDAATDRALALAPEDPTPLRTRCRYRASIAAWAPAIEDCTRFLAARESDSDAHFMLGSAQAGAGQADAAIASFRKAAELDEKDFRPRNNLADLLAKRGDIEGALEAAQEAYRLSNEHPYVADTLGALYLKSGRTDRAISFLEEARKGAPELPDAQLHLAEAYAAAGRADDAKALLDALRASHPDWGGRIDEVSRGIQ